MDKTINEKERGYNLHCPNCGRYLVCNYCSPKIVYGSDEGIMVLLYKCGDCKKYLPSRKFQKDNRKKYGIRYNCKECRSKRGNGN